MVLPIPIIAALIAASATAGSAAYGANRRKSQERDESKRRALESKRETYSDLVLDAQKREDELERDRLAGKAKNSRRKNENLMNTAAYFREGLNI